MRMDKLTSRFQQALADAQSLAVGRDHPAIEPPHLLAALLDQDGGSTQPLLQNAGVNIDLLRSRLAQAVDRLPKLGNATQSAGRGNRNRRGRAMWARAEVRVKIAQTWLPNPFQKG